MASHLTTTGCHRSMVLTILLAARHKRAHPALTTANKAGTRFYPTRRDGRLSCPGRLDYAPAGNLTHDDLIDSPTPKPLRHQDTQFVLTDKRRR